MRLLQVTLRGLLVYALILVLVSIPVSLITIQALLNDEVDRSISYQAERFLQHVKQLESLDDLETDLKVFDQLSYSIHVAPSPNIIQKKKFQTVNLYDSIENEVRPFRQLSSGVIIREKPYLLTVRMLLVDNNELVMAIGLVQVALSILLTVGLLLLNRSLSKRLWRPFYKTLDHLKAYELDKSESIPLEPSNIIEFNDLNKTVSHLTERNRRVFLNQKEFIENASHELQTPIAIFQSKLDMLMQNPHLRESEAEILMDLESTAQRMGRLNKNLLLLSKIDNDQFLDTEEVELSALVTNQVVSLRPMAEVGDVRITSHISPTVVVANRALTEVLCANLLHNAIRYSPKSEAVNVELRDKTLTVSNKGTMLKMDPEKLTERFSKESTDPSSSGLGLAIVKKICDTFGYRLSYSFHENTHIFAVTFTSAIG